MGLIDRLPDWFDHSSFTLFQCQNCGCLYDSAVEACPECGGDVEEGAHALTYDYHFTRF